MRGKRQRAGIVAFLAAISLLTGCTGSPQASSETPPVSESVVTANSESKAPVSEAPTETTPLTNEPEPFSIPAPIASGTEVLGNEKAEIDVSNKNDGYFMVKYLVDTDKMLMVLVTGPGGAEYQYLLNNEGDYDVFPLSDGNGSYRVGVYQNVSGQQYSTECTTTLTVELKDEFAPFIRPNKFVDYNENSKAVKKAAELTRNTGDFLERVSTIFAFVVENVSYDKELAQQILSKTVTNYISDIDVTLETGKGICFDYAALMAAMLRSLGIPTKLVFGNAGTVYHAWISVYSEDTGWIDNLIYFDGEGWKLMDPTFASSSGQSEEVMQFIGDGSNYTVKFTY